MTRKEKKTEEPEVNTKEEKSVHHDCINVIAAKCSERKTEVLIWSFKNMVGNGCICQILLNTYSVSFKEIEVLLYNLSAGAERRPGILYW